MSKCSICGVELAYKDNDLDRICQKCFSKTAKIKVNFITKVNKLGFKRSNIYIKYKEYTVGRSINNLDRIDEYKRDIKRAIVNGYDLSKVFEYINKEEIKYEFGSEILNKYKIELDKSSGITCPCCGFSITPPLNTLTRILRRVYTRDGLCLKSLPVVKKLSK